MKTIRIMAADKGDDYAISENIGAILLVSLVVMGIAVVSVIITGFGVPTEVPSISMISDTSAGDLFLYHGGGDSLKKGDFFVRIDGADYNPDGLALINQEGEMQIDWNSWDAGEVLLIQGESGYNQAELISSKNDQQSLIASSKRQ